MPHPYARNQTDQVRVQDPAVPAFVGGTKSLLKQIKATRAPLVFQTKNLGGPNGVKLIPFYRTHHERYTVYWNLVSAADAKKGSAALAGNVELAFRKALDGEE